MATHAPTEASLKAGGGKELLTIDTKLSSIAVVPKADEKGDANFPRNLHNAAELFLRVGHVGSARKLNVACTKLFECYAQGPGGLHMKMGNGCVCWACGHAGLPANADADPTQGGASPVCASCGEASQTNFVRFTGEGKKELPWVELRDKPKDAVDNAGKAVSTPAAPAAGTPAAQAGGGNAGSTSTGTSAAAPAPAKSRPCGVCGKPGPRQCSRCKAVHYCSLDCQKQHWKKGGHKQECKPTA